MGAWRDKAHAQLIELYGEGPEEWLCYQCNYYKPNQPGSLIFICKKAEPVVGHRMAWSFALKTCGLFELRGD